MRTHEIHDCLDAEIEYGMHDNEEYQLTKSDYEHIQGLIRDGYIEGELVNEDTSQGLPNSGKISRGWWKIIKQ